MSKIQSFTTPPSSYKFTCPLSPLSLALLLSVPPSSTNTGSTNGSTLLIAAYHSTFPTELFLPANGRQKFHVNGVPSSKLGWGGRRVKYLFTASHFLCFYPCSKISSPKPCALLDPKPGSKMAQKSVITCRICFWFPVKPMDLGLAGH